MIVEGKTHHGRNAEEGADEGEKYEEEEGEEDEEELEYCCSRFLR